MKIFDRSILALPLFDDHHRALADRLEAWVEAHAGLPAELAGLTAPERGRRYTALLGSEGWLSVAVDPAPGRDRPDLRSLCLMREAFAYLDDLLDFAFAIQGLAAAPVAWFGDDAQRKDLLPALRSGRTVGSLALSEPACGSNLAALAVGAARQADGSYQVDGRKTWVSNGNIADVHSVLLRTGEGPGGLGLSFLLVPRSTPGLRVAEDIELIAPRAFASLDFERCQLPEGALVGRAGMGFRYAMEILNFYRVTVGAAALGFCRRGVEAAVGWARSRDIAGSKLVQAQFTVDKLSNMALYMDTAALLVARSAWEFDTGVKDVSVHASMAKLQATEGAARVADDIVQLYGAAGLVADSLPERLFRQLRSLRIYEGTSEVQKIIIAGGFGRGAR